MGKRKQPEKMPKKLTVQHTPAINLVDEIKASTELLIQQRRKENHELEYALITTVESADIKDINDEFTREYLFTEQAKVAAAAAIKRMQELGIPTEIPKTYKGEMVKDEKQMAKIRDNLKSKKDVIEKSEKMKKLRELKKMGKKIQEEVLRKRNKEKKEFLEQVKKKPVSELFDD
uniref:Putative rRNA-processing protein EBP2 n=1 Tax=Aceria tosichella TaxID=561515 RepID=A0A6G1SBT7_9ACAR